MGDHDRGQVDQQSPSVRSSADEIEEGRAFAPKFDADGLVTCVATDAGSGDVLMVAHMNAEALQKSIATGRGLVLQPLARRAVAQGGSLRPRAAHRRNARRLRPGRIVDQGRAARARRLSHRPALVLLPRVPLGAAGAVTLEFRDADRTFDPAAIYGEPDSPRR